MFDNPFGNNYKGTGMPKPRSKKDLTWCILCGIAALFCLIMTQWFLALVLIVCSGGYFMLHRKHKANEDRVEDILEKIEEEEDDDPDEESGFSLRRKNKIRTPRMEKEREKRYDEFLASLDEEMGEDFDELDDYDEDDM